jgi:hypothetical protein
MMRPPAEATPCDNLNHRRRDPPVGYCPQCGGTVNDRLPARSCSEAQHAAARRDRSLFCVHCGTQLISER